MADDKSPGVFCKRNQVLKQVDEHLGCPYCFGRLRTAVESGERQQFCDWDEAQDPVSFGFPACGSRQQGG
jgi:hypothetical protein